MLHTIKLTAKDCPDTDEEKAEMLQHPLRPAMFAMVVMPVDIFFTVISCARFSANPGLNHWLAVTRIYRYLIGSAGLKLTYSRIIKEPLRCRLGYQRCGRAPHCHTLPRHAEWCSYPVDYLDFGSHASLSTKENLVLRLSWSVSPPTTAWITPVLWRNTWCWPHYVLDRFSRHCLDSQQPQGPLNI